LHTQHQQATAAQQLQFTRLHHRPVALQALLQRLALEQLPFLVCRHPQATRLLLKQQILLVKVRQARQVTASQQQRLLDNKPTQLRGVTHGLFLLA
jgi:hypothetical protein